VRAAASVLGLAALVGLALLAAGCGGSSGSGAKVAQIGSTSSTTTSTEVTGESKREAIVAFSACMRSHGVPKFPDPEPVAGGMRISIGPESGINPNGPQFKRVERVCRRLLPNGGRQTPQEQAKQLQQALDFSACMRRHGVPKFPDPKAGPGGGIELPRIGVNPKSPQFKAAQKACRKVVPGLPPGLED
jgi:hypothetical protein